MYAKLALGNVRKSARDYAVYFVTIALGVAVFYAFNTIGAQANFMSESTVEVLKFVGGAIRNITFVLAAVLGFLMVYANNYLVRRRKRELGLYQVLGMTRGQVSRVLTLETLFASVGSLLVGMAAGMLLSQLLIFVTAALFNDTVSKFRFVFSPQAALLTIGSFAIIFVVMLLFNLKSLRKVNLAELMSAARKNEQVKVKSLPVTIVVGLLGVALIGIAYARLTHDGLPIQTSSDYRAFGITTAMVTVGTLVFFYALSGIILHLGRLNKSHYFRDINMFTLRQIASRINTVAISMGVITMMLFLAVAISASGFAICAAFNSNLSVSAPYDATITLYTNPEEITDSSNTNGATPQSIQALNEQIAQVDTHIADKGLNLAKYAKAQTTLKVYDAREIPGGDALSFAELAKTAHVSTSKLIQKEIEEGYGPSLQVMSLSDYNAARTMQGKSPVTMGDKNYLLLATFGTDTRDFLQALLNAQYPINFRNTTLTPGGASVDTGSTAQLTTSNFPTNTGTLVVPDSLLEGLLPHYVYVNINYNGDTSTADKALDAFNVATPSNNGDIDVLYQDSNVGSIRILDVYTRTQAAADSSGLTGMIAYVAIYIGFVLIIACAAILAIQQLTAANDAAPNFRVLTEIGVARSMQLASLRKQIALAFAFPMLIALAHDAVALNQMLVTLRMFGRNGMGLYIFASVAVFVVVYIIYFGMTYATARGIVTSRTRMVRE